MNKTTIILASAALALTFQFSFADEGSGKARVVGAPPVPTQDIFEIEFVAINGERILPREMLTLEPDTYILTARIPAYYTRPIFAQHRRRWDQDVDFELTVEAGQDYRVRGKWHRGSLEKPYELVINEVH